MLLPAHDKIVTDYLRAKDEQRPHLFPQVFSDDATFISRFAFETDFASEEPVVGVGPIADVFRRLGAGFEDIYTVMLSDSVEATSRGLQCRWVVAMRGRETREVRVAWGDYDWVFEGDRAKLLDVLMRKMVVLPPDRADAVASWMAGLPQHWCTREQLVAELPTEPRLEPLRTL